MAVDPSIALQVQQPNPANFLSSFVNLGQQKLNLDKSRETFDADVAATKARSSSDVSRATVDAANVNPLIAQQKAITGTAQATESGAKLEAMRRHIQNAKQQTMGLLSLEDSQLTPDAVKASLTETLKNSGATPEALNQALAQMPTSGSPADMRKFIIKGLVQATDAEQQLNRQFPSPQFINNGQQAIPVAPGNAAVTGVAPGSQMGVPTQMQPPPTTQTFNPQTQQPELYGARPDGVRGPVPTAPALGVQEGVSGMVAPNVEHFKGVTANAEAAPMRIGVLQNIKSLAPEAITGDAPIKKKIVSKLAGYLGMTVDEQTPTDVLAKEAALLASKGGNTDMARLLNEAATPNGHMTKDAILKTADQLIGVEKKNVAAQQYFAGTPPNSPQYAERLKAWNSAADPRAFEFAAKTPAEQKAMKSELEKAGQWDALKRSMIQLHMMGVNP